MKKAKYTFLLFALVGLMTACTDSDSNTKSLNDVDQNSSEISPDVIKNNKSADNTNATNPEPKFEFKSTEWDFGTVVAGMSPTYEFQFTNVGDGELVISKVEASCGCTIPEWPEEPIAPGGTGKIHVKFNSAGKSDRQHKTVTIYANTNPPETKLSVTGTVTNN